MTRVITQVVLVGAMLEVLATPALAGFLPDLPPAEAIIPRSPPVGADISYPQCGQALPVGQAFGVVGVNYGRDNTLNPCLSQELAWASNLSTGGTSEPNASVYLNTGDPGNLYDGEEILDWPASGNTPYGACVRIELAIQRFGLGQVSLACAFEYGYLKAEQDLSWLRAAAASDYLPSSARDYPVWLDVENSNTWLSATDLNVADLQGMVVGLTQSGVPEIGVYALPLQWQEITGGASSLDLGSLPELHDWILGAGSLQAAEAECQQSPFMGAGIGLTQFPFGQFDGDYAC
ncbi:MAG: hypothetical protein WA751_09340 [Candidatus Dormiibacterota bacterium]